MTISHSRRHLRRTRRMRPILDALESRIVMSSGLSDPPSTFDATVSTFGIIPQGVTTVPGTQSMNSSIGLSADGQTMITPSFVDLNLTTSRISGVHVFARAGDGWLETDVLYPDDRTSLMTSAQDLPIAAISGDGSTIIASAWWSTENPTPFVRESVYVFTQEDGIWSQSQILPGQISALAISHDGGVIAVGEVGSLGSSYTTIYNREDGVWVQTAQLTDTELGADARFGASIALDAAGDTLVVGAPDAKLTPQGYGTGAVSIYENSGGDWSLIHRELPTAEAHGARLGSDVAIAADGSIVLANGSLSHAEGRDQWAVLTLVRDGADWRRSDSLTIPDEANAGGFGHALALAADGSYAVVTSVNARVEGRPNQGAAFLFRRTESGWLSGAQFTAVNGGERDYFGYAVATAADTIVVTPSGVIPDFNITIYTFDLDSGPEIVDGPFDQKVVASRTATFFASATAPGLSARWQTRTGDGDAWVDVPGATTSATVGDVTQSWYTFTTAPTDSGTRFRAVFSDGSEDVAVSVPAIVQVDRANARVDIGVAPLQPTITGPTTFTVRVSAAVPGMPVPNGGVLRLFVGAGEYSQTLVDGEATFVIDDQISPGRYLVQAHYDADPYFMPAYSSSLEVVVVRGAATMTAEVSAEVRAGQAVDLTAVVTPINGGGPPEGGVVFLNGGQPFAFIQLTPSRERSTAVYSTTLPVGDHYLQWVYLGDPKTSAASSGVYKVTVKANGEISGELAQPFGLPSPPAEQPQWNEPPPTITNDADAVYAGEVVGFTIPAGGVYQSIQWQVQQPDDDSWTDIPGANAARYRLVTTLADAGRRFRAVTTDADGGVATTAPVALNVVPLQPILRFESYTTELTSAAGTPTHIVATATSPLFNGPIPTGSLHLTMGGLEMTETLRDGRATFAVESLETAPGLTPLVIDYEWASSSHTLVYGPAQATENYFVTRSQPTMIPIVDLYPGSAIGAELTSPWQTPAPLGGVLILNGGVPIALVPLVQETSNRSRAVINADEIALGRHYFQFVYLGDPNTFAVTSEVVEVVKPSNPLPQPFFTAVATALDLPATTDVATPITQAPATVSSAANPLAQERPVQEPTRETPPARRTPVWAARNSLRTFAPPRKPGLAETPGNWWKRRSFALFGE